LFAKLSHKNKDKVKDIKKWTRDLLKLSDEDIVMVTELQCWMTDCPPIETIISILKENGINKKYKIFKNTNEVIFEDIFESIFGLGPIRDESCC
jgi:hypothetical protein